MEFFWKFWKWINWKCFTANILVSQISSIWDFFTKSKRNPEFGECNICGESIRHIFSNAPNTSQTRNLRQHLKFQHEEVSVIYEFAMRKKYAPESMKSMSKKGLARSLGSSNKNKEL